MKPLPILKNIPYSTLILFSIFLGLAPFAPEPHLLEKLRFLFQGRLQRPIDIFDLFFHALPPLLLLIKLVTEGLPRKAG